MKRLSLLLGACLVFLFVSVRPAYAGDGATIIFDSGTIVFLANGYQQIAAALAEFKNKGGENYHVEIRIEGENFFINLGSVAIVCRDRCKSMEITRPKKEE